MQVHKLIQGTPEWRQYRAVHFNASDAPAMMGVCPHKTRTQLLDQAVAGILEEHSEFTEAILASGHRFEDLAKPMAEEITGEVLYRVTGSEGKLSASFDGLNMDQDQNFEHKRLNERLRSALPAEGIAPDGNKILPIDYRIQMEQQGMVSKCDRTLFMASEWDRDGNLIEARYAWYYPDPALAARIEAGWAQFEEDALTHVPAPPEAAKLVGRTPENMPALLVTVKGEVTASNITEYKEHALSIFEGINMVLNTDQDFSDAAETVKWCKGVEDRIKATKDNILAQTGDIDTVLRGLDDILKQCAKVRIDLNNKVETEGQRKRREMIENGQKAVDEHRAELNKSFEKPWVPHQIAPFAEAIKGKRSFKMMNDAVAQLLADTKIELNQQAQRYTTNRAELKRGDVDHLFLFADFNTLGDKICDDFKAIAELRIRTHEDAQRVKREAEEKRQADAKREAEEKAQAEADKATQEALARAQAAPAPAPAESAAPVVEAATPAATRPAAAASSGFAFSGMPLAPSPSKSSATQPEDDGERVTLGQINSMLGGLSVNAEFLRTLGYEPEIVKTARHYRGCDIDAIFAAIINHIESVREAQTA